MTQRAFTTGSTAASTTGSTAGSAAGQATVEFVLVLPVLILFVMLVLQVGLVARDRVLLVHAAREAARAAAVDPDPATAVAAGRSATRLDPERLRVTLGTGRASGDRLQVLVGYRSPTDLPVIGLLVGDIHQETEVTIRIE